jgi:hypothetical protein
LWTRSNSKKHGLFSNPSLLLFSNPSLFKAEGKVLGGVVVIVMVRRGKETLTQVKDRLKREQAERTRKRIAELLVEEEQDSEGEAEAEQGSEVEQLLRQSRQILEQVVEERKGTVRVSVSCCYCAVCLVVCIVVCLSSLLVVVVGRQHTNNVTQ